MKKTYKLKAKKNWKLFKQFLTDEEEDGHVNCEVYLSEDLGLNEGEEVKVIIQKQTNEKTH